MAVSRFMKDLETHILEGHNFATVDLFDVDHARIVLTRFGKAFGRLPVEPGGLSDAETEFLSRAAAGLAEDGKVVSVRLALFAEMVRDKPWRPATLEAVGGTKGVGFNFLEETFSSREANPEHRIHQEAAREVLKALLPEVGTDIKGHMRPQEELLEASGYGSRPRDFGDVLRILDGELRLITPTDREGSQAEPRRDPSSKYYQLTHDYLVPSLREWLTCKQKETAKGRAMLRLEERSSMWQAHPQKRYLPNLWEYCSFCMLTRPYQRTHAQNQTMRAAGRYLARLVVKWICVLALLLVGGSLVAHRMHASFESRRADELVLQLWHVEWVHLPRLVRKMQPLRQYWAQDVRAMFDSKDATPEVRLRASLALADTSLPDLPFVAFQLLNTKRSALPIIAGELAPYGDELAELLWDEIEVEQLSHSQQLARWALIAQYDASNPRWSELGPLVVNSLLQTDPVELVQWTPLLDPARRHLVKPLIHHSVHSDSDRRFLAASILAHLALRDERLLSEAEVAELILNSDGRQFGVVVSSIAHTESAVLRKSFRDVLSRPAPLAEGPQVEEFLRRQANAVGAMYRSGHPEDLWSRLDTSPDPRLRTRLIDSLADFGVPWSSAIDRAESASPAGVRQAAVLSLASYGALLTDADRQRVVERLQGLFSKDSHFAVHAAAGWLLGELSPEFSRWADSDASGQELSDRHNWYVTGQNQHMVRIPAPGVFQMGSPESEKGRDSREYRYDVPIDYDFAISSHEITVRQFLESEPDFEYATTVSSSLDCPVTNITFYDAMRYCRWLSEREGIAENEMCYPPINEIVPRIVLAEDFYRKTGYRLPREAEWECAVRAGTVTSCFFGNSKEALDRFTRHALNSDERIWPVGRMQPNPLGLFDVYGNVAEWCHIEPQRSPAGREMCRGGAYRTTPRFLRSAMPFPDAPQHRMSVNGFRIVRTLK
ncbi:MAG: SUMF1/EgtB/PvdO family nonheme iron enzyme [Planctomycetes bacterium]|nr:SUMF1/EgtB/PvdO family nonheme iron enzyme [Planctomycetota bacterium]